MKLLDRYKTAFRELEPHLLIIWIAFYLASFTAFIFWIPMAGFLVMLLQLKKSGKKPELGDLLIQFDQFVPLLILFILAFILTSAITFFAIILMAMSGFLHQAFRFIFLFGCVPFLISGLTYTLLLICDQKVDSISAMRHSINVMQKNPREHYLLGLGTLLLSIPCLLGAPLGYHALVVQYQKEFVGKSV